MKNLIIRLFLIITSVLLVFSFAEAGLYLFSKAYYAYRIKNVVGISKDKNTIKILCLGDSNTFGMGADKGYSYPEQLERMFKERNTKQKIEVYNAGVPGNTSSRLLANLEEQLQNYNPDILIVLIGANDADQIQEANYFLFKASGFRGLIFKLEYCLSRFRVYRLLKLGADTLRVKLWKKRLVAKYKNHFESFASSQRRSLNVDQKTTAEYYKHIEAGDRYWSAYSRKVSLAIDEFKQAIAVMPDNAEGYLRLAEVFHSSGKDDQAMEILEKAKKLDPSHPAIYLILYQVYYNFGNLKLAQDALEKYLYFNPAEISKYLQFLRYGLPSVDERGVSIKLLKYNLNNIIQTAKRKKLGIILQNYPDPLKAIQNVQLALEEAALMNKVTFVNNRLVFRRIELQESYKYAEYFSEDTHCNNRGYSVMAEHIYNVMADAGYLL
jgi:lysophospholipase L1-like esterase